ncbi:Uncharacterized protein TCM_003333 [Theobroma cacao]|uniref:Reverse transcriptase Ty1/copia-type domain-containing protein n=1 Tax=Theobroma cacao TaxID=3641 RepID=A0A061DMT5_THECC|nr:Uncharacterized protein TCM_003333 [Theobroma cacao]
MSSKTFILLALLAAVVLLISSEVAARDLAETTTKINNEQDAEPQAPRENAPAAQVKQYEEEVAKKFRALSFIQSAVFEDIFNQILKLTNQIKLFGEELKEVRVAEKILNSVPGKFEPIIASLLQSKDLSDISITEIVSALQVAKLRISARDEAPGEKAFLAKGKGKAKAESFTKKNYKDKDKKTAHSGQSSNKKNKFKPCSFCKKRNHTNDYCCFRPDAKCKICSQSGHTDKSDSESDREPSIKSQNKEWWLPINIWYREGLNSKLNWTQIKLAEFITPQKTWSLQVQDLGTSQQLNTSRSKSKLELIHSDIGGPLSEESLNGKKDASKFWAEAANTTVYLQNLLPTHALNNQIPFEAWYGFMPSVVHLKVFGCNWNEPQPQLSSPSQHDQTSAFDAQLEIQEDESIDDLPVRGTRSLEDIYQNSLVTIEEPSCYTEAFDRPADRNIIGVKWIFKKKLNPDGSLNRCKARLVAKGYSQLLGVDYGETFAPVARYDTIKLLLALAAALKWNVYHLDIKFAFLNGILEEEIYIDQPEGFELLSGENKHMIAAKRILRYLKKTELYGIHYTKIADFALCGYIDSDFAGSSEDVKSTSESKYVVAAEAANQALWLRKLLVDIKFEQKFPTDLFIDNKSAIAIAKNPIWHGKTKHINVKYHAIRNAVEKNEINVQYCPSELQLAYILTKPLQKLKFEALRTKLNLSIASEALETTEVGTNDAKYGGYGGHGGYEGYDGYSGPSGYGGYGSAVAMADMVDVEGLEDVALSVAVVLIIMEEVATSAALILARQSMLKLMRILTTNVAFARV